MSTITVLAVVAVIVALAMGGVLEIGVNTDKLAGLPEMVTNLIGNKSFIEDQKANFITLKRKVELYLVEKEEDKIDLMITFANEDVTELKTQLEEKKETAQLLPRAELLITTLQQIGTQAEKTPVDHLASLKGQSQEVFIAAGSVLTELQKRESELAYLKEDLNKVTSALEGSIGQFKKEPAVAGAEDRKEDTEKATPTSAPTPIPLKF